MGPAMGGPHGAAAPNRKAPRMRTRHSLDFADAEAVASACRAMAQEIGVPVTIAVTDDTGALLHLQRLDGAKAYSVELASRKARTAATLALSTAILEQMAKKNRLPSGDILALGGGLPVKIDGQCAGAVGISGSNSANDERIAAAGIAVLAVP
jgi:glc operon protein GlcG